MKDIDKTALLFVESLFSKSCEKMKVDATGFKVSQITGDASARRYYRLTKKGKSYIACLNDPDETLNNFFNIQNVFVKEKIPVPDIYDFIEDKGYLLQEDLGDVTVLKHLGTMENFDTELDVYKKIIDKLMAIHRVDTDLYLDQVFSRLSFDLPKYSQEVSFTVKHLIEGLFEQSLSDKDKSFLLKSFDSVCRPLVSQKFVLTHRDFHSRNIMFDEGNYKIIDFQDARMGIPQYDLVSLLEDCYYSIDHTNKEKLKKYYWENFLKHKGYQSSYEEFLKLYDYMTIQRTFKALGSFAFIYRTREDKRYLKYIGYSFEKLRRSMMGCPELQDLRHMLAGMYYEY